MEIGKYITINNRRGIICFKSHFNGVDYINVCFDENNEYVTYRVTKDGEDFILDKETDKNTLSSLLAIWVNEELGE